MASGLRGVWWWRIDGVIQINRYLLAQLGTPKSLIWVF